MDVLKELLSIDYILWLILFVVFSAMELASLGLTCIWLAIGALAACFVGVLGAPFWCQILVFIVVTIAVLIFIRPLAVKHINNKAEKTNVESMVGKSGLVVEDIDNVKAQGRVKIGGMDWTARSESGESIAKDTLVVIQAVEGVKVIVKKAD